MKILLEKPLHLFLVIAFQAINTHAQGTFQNLGFEAGNVTVFDPPNQNFWVPFSDAFPNWTGYYGTNQAGRAGFNSISIGSVAVCLIGHNSGFYTNFLISGNYTAVLQAGVANEQPLLFGPAAMAQTGLIPSGSLSLRFSMSRNPGDLEVSFDGQNLPFFLLDDLQKYQVYGADIAQIAGVMGELRFTERPISDPFATVYLDDIFFSNQPIPEPSVSGLFALGALLLGWRFLRRRSFSVGHATQIETRMVVLPLKPAKPPSNRSGRTCL